MSDSHLLKTRGFNQLALGLDGYYLYNRNDRYIGPAIEKYGEFSVLERNVLMQLCVPGDVVIEVGANIGAHTIALARRVGDTGRVIAFEPQRIVFQTLCANVALNSLRNVDCHWAAAGERDGVMVVPELDPTARNNFGGLSLRTSGEGRKVRCFRLDSMLELPALRLMKVDVEGMELPVMRGAAGLITRFRPFLYVENDRPEKSEELMRLIDSWGYRLYWHKPPLFNPDNLRGDAQNIFPKIVSFNMLCVHRDAGVEMRNFPEITDLAAHPLKRLVRRAALATGTEPPAQIPGLGKVSTGP